MPPRSRTKPGSTTRRPKVAGLRQHAHAGPASTHPEADPDVLDPVETPEVSDGPVDDREVPAEGTRTADVPTEVTESPVDAATTSVDAAPAPTADPDGDAGTASSPPGTDAAPAEDTAVLPTSATVDTPTEAGTVADDREDASTAATTTTSADTTADTTAATGAAATAPATEPTASTSTDVVTESGTDPATDATTESGTDPATDSATTTAVTPTRKGRGRGRGRDRMAPRPEASTAPTRERPARRAGTGSTDDTATATPTRTAKPTRTGGTRSSEPEAAPRTGRLAGVRTALARFAGSRALPITLVAVIVVCLVLAGLAFWQGRQAWTSGPVSNAAVVDVSATAELVGQTRESIEKIFSYDYTRLDDSVEAARTMSTGQFTERYLSVFDQTIRDPAMQQQLRQTATAVNMGVVSLRDDRAEVMVLVQFAAQRTSTGQSTNAPGLLRAEMQRVDGRWKLAELNPLTGNR